MNEYGVQGQKAFEWHGFPKVWLWIVFIANILSVVLNIAYIVMGIVGPISCILGIIAAGLMTAGAALLLFKKKKLGFFLTIGAAVVTLICNVITFSIIGILTSGIGVLILWLVIRNDMPELE